MVIYHSFIVWFYLKGIAVYVLLDTGLVIASFTA